MSFPSADSFDDNNDDEERPFTITRTTAGMSSYDSENNEEEDQIASTPTPITRRTKKQGPKQKLPSAANFEEHAMPYSRKPHAAQAIIPPHLQFGEPVHAIALKFFLSSHNLPLFFQLGDPPTIKKRKIQLNMKKK
jgi:hypothetical protein